MTGWNRNGRLCRHAVCLRSASIVLQVLFIKCHCSYILLIPMLLLLFFLLLCTCPVLFSNLYLVMFCSYCQSNQKDKIKQSKKALSCFVLIVNPTKKTRSNKVKEELYFAQSCLVLLFHILVLSNIIIIIKTIMLDMHGLSCFFKKDQLLDIILSLRRVTY